MWSSWSRAVGVMMVKYFGGEREESFGQGCKWTICHYG